MRINSSRQTEASRKNGLKSNGPKSINGKNKIRLNALKQGLFSQEIVIESAGERLEDFEQLKKEIWDYYRPVGAMEEILVTDIVENNSRRLRVRHCETTELDSRIKAQEIRERLDRVEAVETLKNEFLGRFHALLSPTGIEGLHWDDRVQERLASTSLGMDFLISQMEYVKALVSVDGYPPFRNESDYPFDLPFRAALPSKLPAKSQEIQNKPEKSSSFSPDSMHF